MVVLCSENPTLFLRKPTSLLLDKVYTKNRKPCVASKIGGGKDSAWCTTYKAPDHFNSYYFSQGITLYYIRVKSPELIEKVKTAFPDHGATMVVVS